MVSFWNVEGVALRRRGVRTREFRVDEFGAPRYPELVLAVERETLEERRALVDDLLAALAAGTRSALGDRQAAVDDIVRASGADEPLVRAQFEAVASALRPPLRLDRQALEGWAEFDERFGILSSRPDIDARVCVPARLTGEHRVHQRGPLAGHARARHHPVEAGRLGALSHVLLDVRVEAEPRHVGPPRLLDALVGLGREVDHQEVSRVARADHLVASGAERALELGAEQQVGAQEGDSGHAGRLLVAPSAELLAHRLRAAPHLNHLDAPGAGVLHLQLARRCPVRRADAACPRTVSGAAACPNSWADPDAPVPVVPASRAGR